MKARAKKGISIIEALIAALILSVAIVGTGGFRYHSVIQTKRGERHIEAARIAVMLLENWNALGGDEFFDPGNIAGDLGMTINDTSSGGLTPPSGFFLHGRYAVSCQDSLYFALLSTADAVVQVSPPAINVTIGWRHDSRETHVELADTSLSLTAYTEE